MLVILGTAHMGNTSGKCSPDGKFRESVFSREVCQLLKSALIGSGYNACIDIPELSPSRLIYSCNAKTQQTRELNWRINFVNEMCNKYGKNNVIYVSIHVDAAGMGDKWMNARGWSVYTSKGQTKSDELATCLYNAAEKHIPKDNLNYLRNDFSDGDPDKEAGYAVLTRTHCPAVLTENLFQDNKQDVEWLSSDIGIHHIVRLHFEGIVSYINKLKLS